MGGRGGGVRSGVGCVWEEGDGERGGVGVERGRSRDREGVG